MVRSFTVMQVDAQLHQRLHIVRRAVSVALRFNENSLGLGPLLGLLLDHWEATPPDGGWLEAQVALYPKRGRPRKSEPACMEPVVALRKKFGKGHELFSRRAGSGSAYKIFFCKFCDMQWSTWESQEAPAQCPRVTGFANIYNPKIWTQKDLLALGFEADEVTWAQPTTPVESEDQR